MPSIRQIARRWNVAVATATKVTAVLRDEGLVETKVGAGTVVSAGGRHRRRPATDRGTSSAASPPPRNDGGDGTSNRTRLLRTAIAIADAEGIDAVSMRRIAAHLGVGPMSLYREVANKDDLLTLMADSVFAEMTLPDPGPPGWRAKLELIARQEWRLFRRHNWLPRVVSFTRPLLAPNMMMHTEWTLRAIDGLPLPMATRVREVLTLHSMVLTAAMSLAEETEAEQNTGLTLDGWRAAQRERSQELLNSGRFPLLAAMHEDTAADLDQLFEYALARHLDGFAALVAAQSRPIDHP